MPAYLQFQEITKTFPGVKALSGVSFDVDSGEIHGLLGENGAGKSTLLKVLGGEYVPDSGSVFIDGQVRRFSKAADSISTGVAVIHQELQYVPHLSVAENLLLGRLPNKLGFLRSRAMMDFVHDRLRAMGVSLDPRVRLGRLSIAQRQMVEICKALLRDARIIALDEPTSSLSFRESEVLFKLMRELRAQGRVLIYVSHRLNEIFNLCDGCTIFRDGKTVATHSSLRGVTRDELVHQMVGREIRDIYGFRPRTIGNERLNVSGLCGADLPTPATLKVRKGEIVSLFGLIGAGRTELVRLIAGADRAKDGTVSVDGKQLVLHSPKDAIDNGIVLCPEDRKEDGIIATRSVTENVNLSCRRRFLRCGLFIDRVRENNTTDSFIRKLSIKTPHRRQMIRFLSGGNQQKVILARWLAEENLRTMIMDEPTRGIDVGAKYEIYQIIYQLAEQGCAVLVVSSELPEVLGISDRILVMRQGAIVGELSRAEANEKNTLKLALPAAESLL
jgi:L-arabinose transport system ATP-binding protein